MYRRCTTVGFTVLTTLVVAAAGCTVDNAGGAMFIVQNQVPEVEGAGCILSPDENSLARQEGFMDLNQAQFGYDMYPLVESRVVVADTQTAEQRIVFVQGADIELRKAGSDEVIDEFSKRFSGSLDPEGGQRAFFVEVIEPESAPLLGDGDVVIASVEIFGELGGSRIESDPFEFPITICRGCLTIPIGDCAGLPAGFVASGGGECKPQDAPLECCTDAEGEVVCPAAP